MTLALATALTAVVATLASSVEASALSGTNYSFTTLNSSNDPTFNQLLGINDQQVIAGYFGSGASGAPNKGYTIDPPYGQDNYNNENFPGSVQTQVTAINDFGNTAGFWANAAGANFGFVEQGGSFTTVTDPKTTSKPAVNQILGRNNANETVGFYNDAKGHSHAYEYNVNTKKFVDLTPPNAVSAMATGINDEGDVVGTLTTAKGATEGFLLKGVTYTDFEIDGSGQTSAFGVNDILQIVGSYTDSSGVQHGFVQNTSGVVYSVDDPNGVGSTVVNGINNGGSLVGFYTDTAGNTDGFVATPTSYQAG
jgi:probable HAF family extracellular repeat protein